MANFTRDAEKAQSIIRAIYADFREIEAQTGSASIKIEAKIRSKLQNLTVEIDALSNSPIIGIPKSDQDRRDRILHELEDSLAMFQRKLKNLRNPSAVEMMPRSDSFKNLSEDELHQRQKPMIQGNLSLEQDKTIDELIGSASRLRVVGESMGQELDLHLYLINDLEKNVDATTIKLSNTEAKMVRLLERSSNSCLVCVIFILSVLLILVIVYT